MQFYIDIPSTVAPRAVRPQGFVNYGYHVAQPINPREKYLTALAGAKAAEAEYLAAQAAALREEEALEQRLKQLRHQREQEAFHQTPYDFPLHRSVGIDAEIPHHGLVSRGPASRSPFSWGDARGANSIQEGSKLRYHGPGHHQHRTRPQCFEPRDTATYASYPGRLDVFNETDIMDVEVSCNPFEQRFEGEKRCPMNKAGRSRCSPGCLSQNTKHAAAPSGPTPAPQSAQKPLDLQAVIQAILGATNESQNPQTLGLGNIQQAINAILPGLVPTDPTAGPSPSSADSLKRGPAHEMTNLQELFNTVLGLQPQVQPRAPQPEASAEGSKSTSIPSKSGDFQRIFSAVPQSVTSRLEPQTSTKPVAPAAAEKPAESSLKKELESRLNNEYETEVRDTIQALLASLADSPSAPAPSLPSSQSPGKGKGKAPDSSETRPPTPNDIDHSMSDVRNIEAAFAAIESDFTFPPQLDFITPAPAQDRPASPVSDSESSTSRLAFTARNHPVRFYEQALSTLLVELDAIDSFGNEALRLKRKEIVGKVGHALEELEKEVEGRWRSRSAKERKSAADVTQDSPAPVDSLQTTVVPIEVAQVTPIAIPVDAPSQADVPKPEPEPTIQELQSTTPHESPEETTPADEPEFTLTSASEATIRPDDLSSEPEEPVDTYLLPTAPSSPEEKPKQQLVEGDAGSEWSEVEA